MKKVFAFIGSPAKTNSNTAVLTQMFFNALIEKDKTIECELFTAGQLNIYSCKGCWNCLRKGFCAQDATDSLALIKEKMLGADFIIFGSPVYTMHVSGQTKTFLDRLCAWYHILPLSGKTGMTVTTTASAGQKEVHDFLSMLMSSLGIKIVSHLDTLGYLSGMLANKEDALKAAKEAADIAYPYIIGEKTIETDENLENAFQTMKSKVTYAKDFLPADYKYWKEHNMLGLNSFAELLKGLKY